MTRRQAVLEKAVARRKSHRVLPNRSEVNENVVATIQQDETIVLVLLVPLHNPFLSGHWSTSLTLRQGPKARLARKLAAGFLLRRR